MRVELGSNYRYVRSGPEVAVPTGRAQDAAAPTTAASATRQYDFSSMTRGEMRDWVNERIRSGQMSLDEGAPFMMMTMKIPVGGGPEVAVADDPQRINFIDKARGGIAGALSRNDAQELRQLQAALNTMLGNQRQTTGISIRA